MKRKIGIAILLLFVCTSLWVVANDWRSGIAWVEPKVITTGEKPGDPPSDAIVLFDGKDLSQFETQEKPWIVEDGAIVITPGGGFLVSKQKFGSVQVHLEFATPAEVKGNEQGRGNSGLYFCGNKYEVQILDSYENPTYFDGQCASIYKQRPPLVNACRKPGEWQTYDVVFNRPELKIENNKVVEVIRPGYVTVFHNGVLVVNHHELEGSTFWHQPPTYEPHAPTGPISLQDHGDKLRFRNVWVREIPDTNEKPPRTKEPYYL